MKGSRADSSLAYRLFVVCVKTVQSGKYIAVIRFGPKDEDAKPKPAKAKAVEKEVAEPAAEAPAKKAPAKRKKAAEKNETLI
jgi:hypothetical protein